LLKPSTLVGVYAIMKNMTEEKTRDSDSELEEFKEVILQKIAVAREDLAELTASLAGGNPNGTDDTAGGNMNLEDGSTIAFEKEAIHQLAARQKKFIEQLDAALARVGNKTYGICRTTGKLIQKERLLAVPHTTQSMEAKLRDN
jgi:DnaK suppressor protein